MAFFKPKKPATANTFDQASCHGDLRGLLYLEIMSILGLLTGVLACDKIPKLLLKRNKFVQQLLALPMIVLDDYLEIT